MATLLRADAKAFPPEFALYRFCKEFHCLPQDVDAMPDALYRLFRGLMEAEADDAIMRSKRQRQAPPPR